MSKAGYPYDNAPMERYFNTLKNDLIYQHYYRTEDEPYTAVEEFAYVQYNHVRPHSYNNYKTPYEARHGCQTAHCGRYIPHFDFGAKPSPIVPYRHLPQSLSGMTADCRSLV